MSFDPTKVKLPPDGAVLRLPPKNKRVLTSDEVYAQVRRHLKDGDGDASTMSVQMKHQTKAGRAQPIGVCTAG
jgi:hypothetical protein